VISSIPVSVAELHVSAMYHRFLIRLKICGFSNNLATIEDINYKNQVSCALIFTDTVNISQQGGEQGQSLNDSAPGNCQKAQIDFKNYLIDFFDKFFCDHLVLFLFCFVLSF
jgi:hypothetical protein